MDFIAQIVQYIIVFVLILVVAMLVIQHAPAVLAGMAVVGLGIGTFIYAKRVDNEQDL